MKTNSFLTIVLWNDKFTYNGRLYVSVGATRKACSTYTKKSTGEAYANWSKTKVAKGKVVGSRFCFDEFISPNQIEENNVKS